MNLQNKLKRERKLMSEYKLQVEYLPPIASYTFANDKTLVFQKMKELPVALQSQSVKTEFDLSKAWAEFAEQALDGEYAESKTKCWHGHYEQFGRVMLELMRMSRDKKEQKIKAIAEMTPDIENFTFIAEPCGTEDRTFYRLWFALIGHPDFQSTRIARMEYVNYNYWDYLMGEAVGKVNEQLHKLSK
jgi:hypothetical protein